MKFKPVKFGFVVGIFWAFVVFVVALANLFFPGYGVAFLELIDGIYPGYTFGQWGFMGCVVAALYSLLDGFIAGLIFGWLFNTIHKD
jgi:hypothetical protein